MQYNEIKLKIAVDQLETASAITNMVVPYGIYIEDYSDIEEFAPKIAHIDLIEEELLQRDREHAIIHLYIPVSENPMEAISFIRGQLAQENISYQLENSEISEEDWADNWKRYYFPTKVGQRLVVCPSWESYEPKEDEVKLVLDPGMAFGTGTHDTTQLCMQLLEDYCKPDTTLLDIGTGSGILAISALLLGIEQAVGVDIDAVAVRVAKENAKQNQVEDRVQFYIGDLTETVSGRFSLITANIVADVIIRLTDQLDRFLQPDGVFIASGIIDTREQEVVDTLCAAGYQICASRKSGGWVALAAKRV